MLLSCFVFVFLCLWFCVLFLPSNLFLPHWHGLSHPLTRPKSYARAAEAERFRTLGLIRMHHVTPGLAIFAMHVSGGAECGVEYGACVQEKSRV